MKYDIIHLEACQDRGIKTNYKVYLYKTPQLRPCQVINDNRCHKRGKLLYI